MADKKQVKRTGHRVRQAHAVEFTIWSQNGEPITDEVIEHFQSVIEQAQMDMFFQGHRILTQTTSA